MIKPSIFVTAIAVCIHFIFSQIPCDYSLNLNKTSIDWDFKSAIIKDDIRVFLNEREINLNDGFSKNAKGEIKVKFGRILPKQIKVTFGVKSLKDQSKRALSSIGYTLENIKNHNIKIDCIHLENSFERIDSWNNKFRNGELIMVLEIKNDDQDESIQTLTIPINRS